MAESEDDNTRSQNSKKDVQEKPAIASGQAAGTGKLEGKLIVKEARSTGSVEYKGWELFLCPMCAYMLSRKIVWKAYFLAGRGWLLISAMFLSLLIAQASQILSSYTLVWWQAK